MKKAMTLFVDGGLEFLGIYKKVKEIAPTEEVILEASALNMDYCFLMEDDSYLHFEFQSTDKGKSDLRRFRVYEAILSHKTGKEVFTYVIYSGGITSPQVVMDTGFSQYRIRGITMADRNGDQVLKALKLKLDLGQPLTNGDLMGLTFTPIMGGQWTQVERINEAVKLSHRISDSEVKTNIQSILFAFASKFLTSSDLERIKEGIRMTQLGDMIYEDGMAIGIEQGLTKGKIEMVIALLDVLPDEVLAQRSGLTLAHVVRLRAQEGKQISPVNR